MDTSAVRRYNMFVRVKEFGAAHADLFPAGSVGAQRFADLGAVLDRLNTHVASEASGRAGARQAGATRATARAALRQAVSVVIKASPGVAAAHPNVSNTFRAPRTRTDHDLVTTAERFATEAAPLSAAFVSCGAPSTYVPDLQAKLDAFQRADNDRAAARQTHMGARAGIAASIESASVLVQQLDLIVEHQLGNDPELLTAWQSARHVDKPAMRSVKPAQPSADAAPSASHSAPSSSPVSPHPATPEPAAPTPAAVKAA